MLGWGVAWWNGFVLLGQESPPRNGTHLQDTPFGILGRAVQGYNACACFNRDQAFPKRSFGPFARLWSFEDFSEVGAGQRFGGGEAGLGGGAGTLDDGQLLRQPCRDSLLLRQRRQG